MINAPNRAGTNSANCAKLLCSRSRNVMRALRLPRAVIARAPMRTARETRGSIPRPPLHVEDGTAVAFRADEPLATTRVPEPERSAADRARRETDTATGTGRGSPRRHGVPDLTLLVRRELRLLRRHAAATETTTLPNCWPDSRRSKAR